MADLSAKKRDTLPAKDFGRPETARIKDDEKQSGNYPMPDKAHARNSKSRAAQPRKAGNLTKAEEERIDRKADQKLKSGAAAERRHLLRKPCGPVLQRYTRMTGRGRPCSDGRLPTAERTSVPPTCRRFSTTVLQAAS